MKKREKDVILSIKQGIFTAMTGVIIASNVVTPVYAAENTVPAGPDPDDKTNEDNENKELYEREPIGTEYKDGEGNTIEKSEYDEVASTDDLGVKDDSKTKLPTDEDPALTEFYTKEGTKGDSAGQVIEETTRKVTQKQTTEDKGNVWVDEGSEEKDVDDPQNPILAVLVDKDGHEILDSKGQKQWALVTKYHYSRVKGYYESEVETDTETIEIETKKYTIDENGNFVYKPVTEEEVKAAQDRGEKGYDKVEFFKNSVDEQGKPVAVAISEDEYNRLFAIKGSQEVEDGVTISKVYYSIDAEEGITKEQYDKENDANEGKGVKVYTINGYETGRSYDVEVDLTKDYVVHYSDENSKTPDYIAVGEEKIPATTVVDGEEVDNPEYKAVLEAIKNKDVKPTFYLNGEPIAIDKNKTYEIYVGLDEEGNSVTYVKVDGEDVDESEKNAVLGIIDIESLKTDFYWIKGANGEQIEVGDITKFKVTYPADYDANDPEKGATIVDDKGNPVTDQDIIDAVMALTESGVACPEWFIDKVQVPAQSFTVKLNENEKDNEGKLVAYEISYVDSEGNTKTLDSINDAEAIKAILDNRTAPITVEYRVGDTLVNVDYEKTYSVAVRDAGTENAAVIITTTDDNGNTITLDEESADYVAIKGLIQLGQIEPEFFYVLDAQNNPVDTNGFNGTYKVYLEKGEDGNYSVKSIDDEDDEITDVAEGSALWNAIKAAAEAKLINIEYYVDGYNVGSSERTYTIAYDKDGNKSITWVDSEGNTGTATDKEFTAVENAATEAGVTPAVTYLVNGEAAPVDIFLNYTIEFKKDAQGNSVTIITSKDKDGNVVEENIADSAVRNAILAAVQKDDVNYTYTVNGTPVYEDVFNKNHTYNVEYKYYDEDGNALTTPQIFIDGRAMDPESDADVAIEAAARANIIDVKYSFDGVELPENVASYAVDVHDNDTDNANGADITVIAKDKDGNDVTLTEEQIEAVKKAISLGALSWDVYAVNDNVKDADGNTIHFDAGDTYSYVEVDGSYVVYKNAVFDETTGELTSGTPVEDADLAEAIWTAAKNNVISTKFYINNTRVEVDASESYTITESDGVYTISIDGTDKKYAEGTAEYAAIIALINTSNEDDENKPIKLDYTYKIGDYELNGAKTYEITSKKVDDGSVVYEIKDVPQYLEDGTTNPEYTAVIGAMTLIQDSQKFKFYVEYENEQGETVTETLEGVDATDKYTISFENGAYVVRGEKSGLITGDNATKIMAAADLNQIKTTWFVGNNANNRLEFTSQPTVKIEITRQKKRGADNRFVRDQKGDFVYETVTNVYYTGEVIKADGTKETVTKQKVTDTALKNEIVQAGKFESEGFSILGKDGVTVAKFKDASRVPVEKVYLEGESEPRFYVYDGYNGNKVEIDYDAVETIASTYDKWYNATKKQNLTNDQIKKFNTFIDSLAIASDFVVYSNKHITGTHVDGNVCDGYLKTKGEGIKTEEVAAGANNYSIILGGDPASNFNVNGTTTLSKHDDPNTTVDDPLIVSAVDFNEQNKNNFYVELGTKTWEVVGHHTEGWWWWEEEVDDYGWVYHNATAQQVADKIKEIKGFTGALAQRVDEEIKISENLNTMADAAQAFMDAVFDKSKQELDGSKKDKWGNVTNPAKNDAKKTLTNVLNELNKGKNGAYNDTSVVTVNLSEYDIANAEDTDQDTPGLIRSIIKANKNVNATIVFNIVNYMLDNDSYTYNGIEKNYFDSSDWSGDRLTIDIGRKMGADSGDNFDKSTSNIIWNFGNFDGIVNIRQHIDGIVVAPKAQVNVLWADLNSSVYCDVLNQNKEIHKSGISRKDLYFTDPDQTTIKNYNPYSETSTTDVTSHKEETNKYTAESEGTGTGTWGTFSEEKGQLETHEERDAETGFTPKKEESGSATTDSKTDATAIKTAEVGSKPGVEVGTAGGADLDAARSSKTTVTADKEHDEEVTTENGAKVSTDSTKEISSETEYKKPSVIEFFEQFSNKDFTIITKKVTKSTETSLRQSIDKEKATYTESKPPVTPPIDTPDVPPTETPDTPTDLPPVDPPTTPPELPPVNPPMTPVQNPPIITIEEPEVPLAGEVLGAKRPRGQVLGAKKGRGDVLGARRTPGTADANNLLQWMSLFGASSGALGAWALRNKKRREDEDKQ